MNFAQNSHDVREHNTKLLRYPKERDEHIDPSSNRLQVKVKEREEMKKVFVLRISIVSKYLREEASQMNSCDFN